MTQRYHSFQVVLEQDIREDDAEFIVTALRMIKGVIDVKPLESSPDSIMAQSRASMNMEKALWDAFKKLRNA